MDDKKISEDLISALKKYKSVMICIKGSPDPDSIASSYALSAICSALNIKSRIVSPMKPSLPQNSAFIDDLDIPVHFEEFSGKIGEFDAYCVLDFQTAYIKNISEKIPCAVHIDHHDFLEENINIDFNLTAEDLGSTSTIFAFIIKYVNENVVNIENINNINHVKLATALLYGIYADTDAYKHADHYDFEALLYLSQFADRKIIEQIIEIPLPKEIMKHISYAVKNKLEYKGWLFAGIGFIDEEKRDSIAIVADFLVQRFSDVSLVIVFAGIQKKNPAGLRLDASFRTEDEDVDLNRLIKLISASGGGRKYKGAYQVDLNYFVDCPDNELLWKTIECTTIGKLKDLRDNLKLLEIKGIYQRMKARIGKMIRS